MNRLIILSAILLIATIALERALDRGAETERVLKGTLRQLPGNAEMTADAIGELRIERGDTAWTYRFSNGNWHYPAYENAFALNERVKSIVKDLVESYGTIVATQPGKFFTQDPLTIHLSDSTNTWHQDIRIGNSLPGKDTNEAYMALPQSDTIYQVHADPRRTLDGQRDPNLPPLIDPKVLPTALVRRATAQVIFHTPQAPVGKLQRVEIPPDTTKRSPLEGPTYDWYAQINQKRRKVVNASVYAYLNYLSRLKYAAIHDPHTAQNIGDQYIVLTDDQGISDTLDVKEGGQETYLRHRTTGHLYAITNAKATLLFPTPTRLDTLPNPSPYNLAEPTGPFSLAEP